MTDLRTLKKETYSTAVDVRQLAMNSLAEKTHADTLYLNDKMIELFLLKARGIIDFKLGNVISGVTTLEVTPYCGPSLIPLPDEENTGENTSTGILWGLTPASTAYTEFWTFTFTSDTAFSAQGSYSGSQGTGSTAAAFTATNSSISVPLDAWSGTFASGDIYYVPTYKHHPSIVTIATMLAAGLILKGQATGMAPDANPAGAALYDDAMDMLNSLAKGETSLVGVNNLIDASDLLVPYEVSMSGYDVSNYRTDEFSRYLSNTTSYYFPWYYR